MLVPKPSLAKMAADEKVRLAPPAALTLKLMVKIRPPEPVKPGFKTMPSKLTAPEVLEKPGSETQRLIRLPLLESEITSSLSWGKLMTPETAFRATSALETKTPALKVWPVL